MIACVERIARECAREASLGTKISALETLRKIAKSVCLAGDTLGCEVRKRCRCEACLEEGMLGVVKTVGGEERERYLRRGGGGGEELGGEGEGGGGVGGGVLYFWGVGDGGWVVGGGGGGG